MLIKPQSHNKKHATGLPEGVRTDVQKAFETLINYYADGDAKNLSASEKANFEDTPVRAAKAFKDLVWPKSHIAEELQSVLETAFPMEPSEEETGVITQGPISVTSLCPHHMLAVKYEVFVAYRPKKQGMVLGLSKLARVAEVLSKRPVLQEQLARDIVDVLHFGKRVWDPSRWPEGQTSGSGGAWVEPIPSPFPQIESDGSAVQLLGRHSCMSCRGVKQDPVTVTTELRGCFKSPSVKEEFEQAIQAIRFAK